MMKLSEQKKDWLLMAAVTVLALLLLVIRLEHPGSMTFDENWYARDGCWYVLASESQCDLNREILVDKNVPIWLHLYKEVSPEQPPLGKLLIGIGIRIFGFRLRAVRLASVICGAATITLLYLLALKILRSRLAAVVASGLLIFDFLHFVQARLAMLDIFVSFFAVAAYLFCACDRDHILERRYNETTKNGFWEHRWRMAAGVSCGAAIGSKLSGWFVLVAIVLLIATWEIDSRRSDGLWKGAKRAFREEWAWIALAFICLPFVVYACSYAGRLEGSVFAWPWASDSWFRHLVERQFHMIDYHSAALQARVTPATLFFPTFASRKFYSVEQFGGVLQMILVFGNPMWWPAFAAAVVAVWRWSTSRKMERPEGIILSGFAANYCAWLMLTWARSQVMLHYFTPVLPFAYLLVAYLITRITGAKARRVAAVTLLGVAIFGFVFFYPVLAAMPMSEQTVETYVNIANRLTGSK